MARRFRPLRTWKFWVGWVIVLLVFGRAVYVLRHDDKPSDLREGVYSVAFVIDGDTLVLDDGKRVRLIGVDTPETHDRDHPVELWGPEAETFSRDFVARAKSRLQLQFDAERVDRYGRYLAYAWAGDQMLNEELIRAGLGRFEPGYRYAETMKRRFRAAERDARDRGVGIWSGPLPTARRQH